MTETMLAVQVPEHGGPEVLKTVEANVTEPRRGEVRIEVRAAGVNFADVEKRRGNYPDGPTPPYRPGLEVAGVVAAAGPGLDLSPGDHVTAIVSQGGYAEQAIARASATFRLPKQLSFPKAAALPVQYLTAHNALFGWGELASDEQVLITAAAGGVGTGAVQLAAVSDATVVGVTSTAEKREYVRELGADDAIDYNDVDDLNGHFDLALDGVGGRTFTACIDALAPGGRLVTYGMASGRTPTVATPRLFFENKSVIGYHLGEALERTPEDVLGAFPDIIDRVSEGTIEVVVDERFSLADAQKAHERLQRRESRGKLILVP